MIVDGIDNYLIYAGATIVVINAVNAVINAVKELGSDYVIGTGAINVVTSVTQECKSVGVVGAE
ncbi:MAG: hypothetical protein ACTS2F_17900 [Thainema sp.]